MDLGKKVGNWDFWDGGVIRNFRFGLRKKSWKFGFLGWGMGGGVICNFGFGLRKKSWKLGFLGWGGNLQLRIWTWGKKFGNWDFWDGGVICNFGFGKKVWKLGFLGGGVICNFGFGLREKSLEIGIFGMELRIWT